MKITSKLMLLALFVCVYACQPANEECNKVILNGKIENANSDKIFFYVEVYPDLIYLDTAYLSIDGSFYTSFKIDSCLPVVLNDGKEISQMYICPGDSLFITLNTAQFDESIHYEGIGAERNNILMDYFRKYKDNDREGYVDIEEVKNTSMASFYDLAAKYRDEINEYATSTIEQQTLEESFSRYLLTDANFTALNLLSTPWTMWSYKTDTSSKDAKEIRNKLRQIVIEAASYDNPDYINIEFWRYYTHSLEWCFLSELLGNKNSLSWEQIDTIFYPQYKAAATDKMFEHFIIYKTERFQNSYDTNSLTRAIYLLEEFSNNESYKQNTIATYQKRIEKIKQALPENAILIDLYEEQYAELKIEDILAEYKGDVIYIDFWGIGCKPCIAEFPYSTKLHNKLLDENVVFLYFSLDLKYEPWREALVYHQQGGIHYRLNGNLQAEAKELYKVWAIPHYVLYDKEGNLIEDNCTWPSDPETEKKIRDLL